MDERRRKFEVLALPHLDAAYNLARWLSRSRADADDILQDAMLRAFRAMDAVRGDDIRAWLLTIVRNCAMSAVQGTRRRREDALPGEPDGRGPHLSLIAEGPDPENAAIGADIGRKLDAVIAGLPEEFREVLVLREMEELSYRQIAEIAGIPIGTVMSRLARARALVKERWLGTVEGRSQHGLR